MATTYFLEVGRDEPATLPYSYARRAQATVYRLHFRQIAYGSDPAPLRDMWKRVKASGMYQRARIIANSPDVPQENLY